MNFTEIEKKEARKNGFIFVGKTGAGKSTLINVLLGEEKCKVERSADRVTTDTTTYYHKLKSGKMITVLDTPGLCDPNKINNENTDNIHLKGIKDVIMKESIQIKGIIFLINFQNERFDSSEQDALINYNSIFPLENFWKHVLVIFTHYFQDPDGDSVEEMKKEKDKSNRDILINVMKKVKNVSKVITYDELQTKYFNSFCPIKHEKQRNKNNKNKEELEEFLNYFCEKEPLFTRIEILTIKDFPFEENNKKYKTNLIILIGFFGLNEKLLKQDKIFKDKIPISDDEYNQLNNKIKSNCKVKIINAERNKDGEIETKNKDGDEGSSYYMNMFKNTSVSGIVGAALGASIFAGAVVATGGLAAIPEAIAVIGGGTAGGGIVGAIGGFIKSLFS